MTTGQSATGTLYVDNAGVGTLDWSIPLPSVSGPVVVLAEPLLLEKGEIDTRLGEPVTEGFGGPDVFGYRWVDSNSPNGPAFSWVDITTTGTLVTVSGDDATSAAIPIGFDFPFYGNTFNSLRVCTNGWLSFTSTATAYDRIPRASVSLSTI